MELKVQATPLDIKNELLYRYNNLFGPVKTRHEVIRQYLFWVIKGGDFCKHVMEMETSHLNNIVKKFSLEPDGSFKCDWHFTKNGETKKVTVTQLPNGVMHQGNLKTHGTVSRESQVNIVPMGLDWEMTKEERRFFSTLMEPEDFLSEDMLPRSGEINFAKALQRYREKGDDESFDYDLYFGDFEK